MEPAAHPGTAWRRDLPNHNYGSRDLLTAVPMSNTNAKTGCGGTLANT